MSSTKRRQAGTGSPFTLMPAMAPARPGPDCRSGKARRPDCSSRSTHLAAHDLHHGVGAILDEHEGQGIVALARHPADRVVRPGADAAVVRTAAPPMTMPGRKMTSSSRGPGKPHQQLLDLDLHAGVGIDLTVPCPAACPRRSRRPAFRRRRWQSTTCSIAPRPRARHSLGQAAVGSTSSGCSRPRARRTAGQVVHVLDSLHRRLDRGRVVEVALHQLARPPRTSASACPPVSRTSARTPNPSARSRRTSARPMKPVPPRTSTAEVVACRGHCCRRWRSSPGAVGDRAVTILPFPALRGGGGLRHFRLPRGRLRQPRLLAQPVPLRIALSMGDPAASASSCAPPR